MIYHIFFSSWCVPPKWLFQWETWWWTIGRRGHALTQFVGGSGRISMDQPVCGVSISIISCYETSCLFLCFNQTSNYGTRFWPMDHSSSIGHLVDSITWGYPQSSCILMGLSLIKQPFWGTSMAMETPISCDLGWDLRRLWHSSPPCARLGWWGSRPNLRLMI